MTSKNRPSWRLPNGHGRPNAVFRGYQSRFGDGHPNRRQCIAKARSTGERCKRDALVGATTCASHGGHVHAYRAAGVTWSKATMRAVPRKELARIGSGEPPADLPTWVVLPVSPVARGRIYEAWLNHHTDLAGWIRITSYPNPPQRYGPHDPSAPRKPSKIKGMPE